MTKIIADFCANHLGDTRLIEQGIKLLASTGVDIIKFQSFSADKLNKDFPDYKLNYDYYKSVELKEEHYPFIVNTCKQYGIEPLFTIFDIDWAPLLCHLGVTKAKIASPDADNIKLVNYCLNLFDEVLVSTGMVNDKTLGELLKSNCKVLYCISKYPTNISDIDYCKMSLCDGFSDHTMGTEASKKAIDLGLEYIEKHFTLGRNLPGRDQSMSTTLDEFIDIVYYRNNKVKVNLYKKRWNP